MTVGKMVLPQDSSFGTLAFLQLFIQMAEYNVFIDNAEVFADAVPDGIAEAVDGQQFFGIRGFNDFFLTLCYSRCSSLPHLQMARQR